MQGQIINGFELKRPLGQGGMAEVWYAENEIGKPAAVKILNESLSHNQQIVERFHNEALVMVKLDHPNIRQVYGYGYLGNRHCIVMEYLEGDDLEELMKSGRRFTDEELRRWWDQTVDALNYTHGMDIVHRDIKPSNLFLDKRGNIKLLDFGIAKVRETMSMTRTGMTMGTLMYMSPEQVKDPKRVGAKSDVYSLAVTFVHLLTGKPVYDCETSSEYDIQVSIVTEPIDLSSVPTEWRGFLAPYLEKDPEKRPALRRYEAVTEVPVATVVAPQPQPKPIPTVVAHQPEAPKSQPKPEAPKPQPTQVASEPVEKPKSKAGLWIGIGVGVAAVILALVLLLKPKSKEPQQPMITAVERVAEEAPANQEIVDAVAQTEKEAKADQSVDNPDQGDKKNKADVKDNSSSTNSGDGIIAPVHWTFKLQDRGNNEFDLVATAKIDPEWCIFSTTMSAMGPLPTEFQVNANEYYEPVGKARDLTKGVLHYDDVFEEEWTQFSGTASFAQTFRRLKKGSFNLKGQISGSALKGGGVIMFVEEINLKYKDQSEAKPSETMTAEEAFEKGVDYIVEDNREEAMKWLLKAANLNHADAQYHLGYIYLLEENNDEARKWLGKAAKNGHGGAQMLYDDYWGN